MCIKNKVTCIIGENNVWRIPMTSGVLGFVLGMSCFGVAMKLLDYKDSPTLPPFLAGIPMLGAGIAGMVGGRMRKQWLISLHTVFCLIASVLSLHLMFLFLGREAESRERYRAKCQSNFKGEFYCHRYAATIAMSAVSVLAVTLAPLGIVSYVVIRRVSAYNVSQAQEENDPTLDRRRDLEAAPKPNDRHPSQPVKQEAERDFNRPQLMHPSKAQPQRHHRQPVIQEAKRACDRPQLNHAREAKLQRHHHQPIYHNYHDSWRVPSSHIQAPNRSHPDHNRYNRQLYQQRNLQRIIVAQNFSSQQSHIPPGQRLQRSVTNTKDASFA